LRDWPALLTFILEISCTLMRARGGLAHLF
jgi:hypothetical protein